MGRKPDPSSNYAKVRDAIAKNPKAKPKEIAEMLGIPVKVVYAVRHREGKKPKTKARVVVTGVTAVMPPPQLKPDLVNHPPHYTSGGIETIDFIEAKKLNYNLGNVVKYITRADLKGAKKQDLEKAMWYLRREIEHHTT